MVSRAARPHGFFIRPKIAIRKILGRKLHGTFLEEPTAIDQSLYIAIVEDDDRRRLKFVLGILLSSVGAWWIRSKYAIYDKLYPWYTKKQLASFPLSAYDDRVVQCVDRMLMLGTQLATARLATERDRMEREIGAVEHQIDQLIYGLYALDDDEISLIEQVAQAIGRNNARQDAKAPRTLRKKTSNKE